MHRHFLLRELRRQAPAALAVIGLALLLVPLVDLALLLRIMRSGTYEGPVGVLLVFLPLVLGAATFAPDLESGAAAFLRTQPLSPTRLFALKVSVTTFLAMFGALLGLAGIALLAGGEVVYYNVIAFGPERADLLKLVAGWLLLLTASMATSLAVRRTLPALVMTPFALGSLLYGQTLVLNETGFRESWAPTAFLALSVLTLAGVSLRSAQRDGASPAWKVPVARLAAALLGAVLASSMLVGGAYAYDRSTASTHFYFQSAVDGHGGILQTYLQPSLSWKRAWDLPVDSRLLRPKGAGVELTPCPPGWLARTLSPDGRRVLLVKDNVCRVYDLDSKTDVSRVELSSVRTAALNKVSHSYLWIRGEPRLIDWSTNSLQDLQGSVSRKLPARMRGISGLRALSVTEDLEELTIHDLASEAKRTLPLSRGSGRPSTQDHAYVQVDDAAALPDGESAILVVSISETPAPDETLNDQVIRPERREVWHCTPQGPTRIFATTPAHTETLVASLSPQGRYVLIRGSYRNRPSDRDDFTRAYDLQAGAWATPEFAAFYYDWSPDGEVLVGLSGYFHVREGRRVEAPSPQGTWDRLWLDDRRFFSNGRIIDVDKGTGHTAGLAEFE